MTDTSAPVKVDKSRVEAFKQAFKTRAGDAESASEEWEELEALRAEIRTERAEIQKVKSAGERRRRRKHVRKKMLVKLRTLEERAQAATNEKIESDESYVAIRAQLLEDDALDAGVKTKKESLRPPVGKNELKERKEKLEERWNKAFADFTKVKESPRPSGRNDEIDKICRAKLPPKTPEGLKQLQSTTKQIESLLQLHKSDDDYLEMFEKHGRNWFAITKLFNEGKFPEPDMKQLWNYRQKVVDKMLDDLSTKYPGVEFAAVGSKTLTSDIDVGVLSHGTKDGRIVHDFEIVKEFNEVFVERFRQQPGIFFDVNLYASAPRVSPLDQIADEKLKKNMKAMANSGQDVGALMKLRRFLGWDEYWSQMEEVLGMMNPETDEDLIETTRRQYEEADSLYFLSMKRILDAYKPGWKDDPTDQTDTTATLKRKKLALDEKVAAAKKEIEETPLNNLEKMKAAQEMLAETIHLIEHGDPKDEDDHGSPAVMMEITNAIYTEAVEEVRRMEGEILKLQQILEALQKEDPLDLEVITGITEEIGGLAARIPTFYADGVFFANEAYHTNGPYDHIVVATQGVGFALSQGQIDDVSQSEWQKMSVQEQKEKENGLMAERRSALSLDACMGSFNEQLGDLMKDFSHYAKEPAGFAFTKASKYLQRFLDSLHLVESKVPEADWTAVNKELNENMTPEQLASAVAKQILPVRKGDTPAGAEGVEPNDWVVARMKDLFEVEDVPKAKAKLLKVGNMVNALARKSMEVAAEDESAYFKGFNPGDKDV